MSAINPDCVAGKHRACSGTAWDETADELTLCTCHCHAAARVVERELHDRRMAALWAERYPVGVR